jgi:Recombinase-like helix-turn-helix domain
MGLAPTRSYEDLLGDRLEALLQAGADTPEAFAAGLNEANVHGPKGERWTAELLLRELARLGA